MKKTPYKRCPIYAGEMKSVNTTLANLLIQPKGSTCLYLRLNYKDFRPDVLEKAAKCGAKVCIEPLIALDLEVHKTFELMRVTIVKTGRKQLRSMKGEHGRKAPRISKAKYYFSASPTVLARCKVGSTAIYEHLTKRNTNGNFSRLSAKATARHYHLIDIRRGITTPIFTLTVTKQGCAPKYKTKETKIYAAYLDN